jgi:hypothetical protein
MTQQDLFTLDAAATKTFDLFTTKSKAKGASKHDLALSAIKTTLTRYKKIEDQFSGVASSLRGVIQRVLPDIEAKDATINNVLDRKRKTIRTYLIDNTKYDSKYITQTLSRVFADIALAKNPSKAKKENKKTNQAAKAFYEWFRANKTDVPAEEIPSFMRSVATYGTNVNKIEKAKAKAEADRKAKLEFARKEMARTKALDAKVAAATEKSKKVTKKAA